MRNQMVNNYRLAYQKIKLRQLETLIQNVGSFKMQKGNNPDASVLLEDIEEASCPLWFVKTIEKYILREFLKQTL